MSRQKRKKERKKKTKYEVKNHFIYLYCSSRAAKFNLCYWYQCYCGRLSEHRSLSPALKYDTLSLSKSTAAWTKALISYQRLATLTRICTSQTLVQRQQVRGYVSKSKNEQGLNKIKNKFTKNLLIADSELYSFSFF